MDLTSKLSLIIPFSYYWILRRAFGKCNSVLDLGCGDGYLMERLSKDQMWEITGVDIFNQGIREAEKRNIYVKLVKGDIVQVSRRLIKQAKRFDVVFCSHTIEHLKRKEGEKLLALLEKLAGKKIVVVTPTGFIKQLKVYLKDNKHQEHKSGWRAKDFTLRGYKVRGVGVKFIWGENGLARSVNGFARWFGTLISYSFSPFVYYFHNASAGIVCIKEINVE